MQRRLRSYQAKRNRCLIMNKEDYKKFKEKYLKRFIKYYIDDNSIQRKELRRSVFDNPNLTLQQQREFWDEVVKGSKNVTKKRK